MIWFTSIPLTREQFEKKRADLKVMGVDVEDDHGQIVHDLPIGSATIKFDYTEPNLELELLDCPRLERGAVESKIMQWFSVGGERE